MGKRWKSGARKRRNPKPRKRGPTPRGRRLLGIGGERRPPTVFEAAFARLARAQRIQERNRRAVEEGRFGRVRRYTKPEDRRRPSKNDFLNTLGLIGRHAVERELEKHRSIKAEALIKALGNRNPRDLPPEELRSLLAQAAETQARAISPTAAELRAARDEARREAVMRLRKSYAQPNDLLRLQVQLVHALGPKTMDVIARSVGKRPPTDFVFFLAQQVKANKHVHLGGDRLYIDYAELLEELAKQQNALAKTVAAGDQKQEQVQRDFTRKAARAPDASAHDVMAALGNIIGFVEEIGTKAAARKQAFNADMIRVLGALQAAGY